MRRDGFTVIEMVMVFVIVGIMTAFAFPRVREAVQRENVRSARALFSTYHAKARYSAILRRGRVTLYLQGDSILIEAPEAVADADPWTVDTLDRNNFYSRYKVTLTIEPSGRTALVFDPRGIGTEPDNTTIWFIKGNYRDSVIITPTGRVR